MICMLPVEMDQTVSIGSLKSNVRRTNVVVVLIARTKGGSYSPCAYLGH